MKNNNTIKKAVKIILAISSIVTGAVIGGMTIYKEGQMSGGASVYAAGQEMYSDFSEKMAEYSNRDELDEDEEDS